MISHQFQLTLTSSYTVQPIPDTKHYRDEDQQHVFHGGQEWRQPVLHGSSDGSSSSSRIWAAPRRAAQDGWQQHSAGPLDQHSGRLHLAPTTDPLDHVPTRWTQQICRVADPWQRCLWDPHFHRLLTSMRTVIWKTQVCIFITSLCIYISTISCSAK